MPTPVPTEAREQLVTWLETTSWRVEPLVPPVPHPPCLVVKPGTPWATPERLGSLSAGFRFDVLCVARDNKDGHADLEQMVHDVLNAIDGLTDWDQVTAPQTLDLGSQGTVLVAEVTITVHVKE